MTTKSSIVAAAFAAGMLVPAAAQAAVTSQDAANTMAKAGEAQLLPSAAAVGQIKTLADGTQMKFEVGKRGFKRVFLRTFKRVVRA